MAKDSPVYIHPATSGYDFFPFDSNFLSKEFSILLPNLKLHQEKQLEV